MNLWSVILFCKILLTIFVSALCKNSSQYSKDAMDTKEPKFVDGFDRKYQ